MCSLLILQLFVIIHMVWLQLSYHVLQADDFRFTPETPDRKYPTERVRTRKLPTIASQNSLCVRGKYPWRPYRRGEELEQCGTLLKYRRGLANVLVGDNNLQRPSESCNLETVIASRNRFSPTNLLGFPVFVRISAKLEFELLLKRRDATRRLEFFFFFRVQSNEASIRVFEFTL